MKLLDEIRQQPSHIRHFFMWTMVVITFSLVGFLWFDKTRGDFVALLNGQSEEQIIDQPSSPFAAVKNSLSDLRANIFELFTDKKDDLPAVQTTAPIPPQKLP